MRYAWVPLFFVIPCILCSRVAESIAVKCSWIEYTLFCFMGSEPIEIMDTMEKAQLPVLWLISIGGCLFLNLDYFLNDLSNAGQQLLIRSHKKGCWYFAKCIWNLCSCAVYFFVAGITITLFTIVMGGNFSDRVDMNLLNVAFRGVPEVDELSFSSTILIAIILPYVTACALSLLQMTLCLIMKPIFSFLVCMMILLLSVYWDSSFVLGNGAMAIRSSLIITNGINPWITALECVIVIAACIIIGSLIFINSDILGARE